MEGAKLTMMALLVIGLGVGVEFGRYVMLAREASDLEQKQKSEEAEKVRLAGVKIQYDEFEKRKQLLQKQINIIEDLKKRQTGPVVLLNALANTVLSSEQLWLTSFDSDGQKLLIDGVADNVNTVADFIANLKRSGQFRNVEIKESFQDDRFKDLPTFVFSITAELQGAPATSKT